MEKIEKNKFNLLVTRNSLCWTTDDLELVFLKVKLIALSDSWSIGYYYKRTSVTTSHREPVFQQMTLIWPFKVTKGQTDHAIRTATYDFL